MKNQVIAKRYAKAIFEIALEEGRVEEYYQELKDVLALFKEVPDFERVLATPIYPDEVKVRTVEMVADKAGMSPIVKRFLEVLVEKQRVPYLEDVVAVYGKLMDEHVNVARAQVSAAVELDETTLELIAESLSKIVGKRVIVEFHQDPDLIGGVVAKIGDLVLDGSVRTQLKNIKETLKRGELG